MVLIFHPSTGICFPLPLLPGAMVFDGEGAQNGAQFSERKYLSRSAAPEPNTYLPESSFDSPRPTATGPGNAVPLATSPNQVSAILNWLTS
jgi:hypothetical protein